MKTILPTLLLLFFGLSALAESHTSKLQTVMKKQIRFDSEGHSLAGDLYLPADFKADQQYPAAIVGGSLTSVKEQMAGTYAEKLAGQGIVALAFDYRHYGASEGQPRQFEDPAIKLKDLQAALDYLLAQDFVKAVGAVGVCTSGGNVAYLAAADERLGATATVAAWLPDAAALPLLYGSEERVSTLRATGREAKAAYTQSGTNAIIPAYHNTDQTASHVGPMEYYMDQNRGGGVPEWKNEFAVMSWDTWLDFDPIPHAAAIHTPFIMIHSDGSALPHNAKAFFEQLPGEKELVWGDGNHFDYYDQPAQVNAAVEAISRFFKAQLQ